MSVYLMSFSEIMSVYLMSLSEIMSVYLTWTFLIILLRWRQREEQELTTVETVPETQVVDSHPENSSQDEPMEAAHLCDSIVKPVVSSRTPDTISSLSAHSKLQPSVFCKYWHLALLNVALFVVDIKGSKLDDSFIIIVFQAMNKALETVTSPSHSYIPETRQTTNDRMFDTSGCCHYLWLFWDANCCLGN